MGGKPLAEIEFCTQCRRLLRAAWLAQELPTAFEAEIGGVAPIPGTGGVFEVRCGGKALWSRKQEGRFPEARELEQAGTPPPAPAGVRDAIAPGRSDSRWPVGKGAFFQSFTDRRDFKNRQGQIISALAWFCCNWRTYGQLSGRTECPLPCRRFGLCASGIGIPPTGRPEPWRANFSTTGGRFGSSWPTPVCR